jgi:predicted extracellular nuclease
MITENITVAFYNVENFFDTVDDPETQDEEFLPDSLSEWDKKKYQNKINNIAKVISTTTHDGRLPDAVGFCEIENETVIKDLVAKSNLKKRKYLCICSTGQDTRGINVGFIYDCSVFDLIGSEELNVVNDNLPYYRTRNVLFVTLKHKATDETVYFFINHWPSRRDGEELTEPKRIYAARILREKIDELLAKEKEAKVIIMGDLNDSPRNKSILKVLKANSSPVNNELLNPYLKLYDNKQGSHVRDGVWELFDNIILSRAFLNGKGLHFKKDNAAILNKDFVLFKNHITGAQKPNRTYGADNKYFNGFSDHLAVYVKLGY